MYEIMLLSGQEYVDEYASHVKSGAVDLDEELLPPPVIPDDRGVVRDVPDADRDGTTGESDA